MCIKALIYNTASLFTISVGTQQFIADDGRESDARDARDDRSRGTGRGRRLLAAEGRVRAVNGLADPLSVII